jgi:hypothetical protein
LSDLSKRVYIRGRDLAKLADCSDSFITQTRHRGLFAGCLRKKNHSDFYLYHKEKCLAILADLDPAKKRKGDGNGLYTEERGKLIRAQRRR